jgi:hypothetical protein
MIECLGLRDKLAGLSEVSRRYLTIMTKITERSSEHNTGDGLGAPSYGDRDTVLELTGPRGRGKAECRRQCDAP